MALPIVPGSQVSTPISGVPIDSGAFRQAALAPGRLAAAVGQNVSGLFEDVSQKLQANRNARTIFDADLAMRKQKDQFTADLAKMPDEGTWLPAWKQKVDSLRDQVMQGPNMNPTTKRALSMKMDVWEAATTSEIRTAALLKGTKETRESAIADATYAAHQGDLDGAQNTLKAAVDHYAMSTADAKKISSRFPSIAAQAQADTAISTNPIQAPDLIKRFEGTIEPRIYVGIQAKAQAAKNRAQVNNLEDLREDMESIPDGTIDPKVLNQKVKSQEITQRMADGLVSLMQREHLAEAKATSGEIFGEVNNYDPAEDKDGSELKGIKERMAGLPPTYYQTLSAAINKKLKTGKGTGDNGEKVIDRLYQAGILGQWRVVDPKTKKVGRDKDAFMAANEKRWDLQDDLDNWRGKNPNASLHDEREYVKTISHQMTVDALAKGLPGKTELKVGDTATDSTGRRAKWNGKEWIEMK